MHARTHTQAHTRTHARTQIIHNIPSTVGFTACLYNIYLVVFHELEELLLHFFDLVVFLLLQLLHVPRAGTCTHHSSVSGLQ